MAHEFTDAELKEIEREARIRVAAERLGAEPITVNPPDVPVPSPTDSPETTLEEDVERLLQ